MAAEIKHRETGAVLWRGEYSLSLDDEDFSRLNLRGADLSSADFFKADLTGADLRGAKLVEAILSGANLTGADLTGADLSRAELEGTILPGFPGQDIESLPQALRATADWLEAGHWLQRYWIKTPTAAFAGDCLACLHGAAAYIGGPVYGPQASQYLWDMGYTVPWNDATERTREQVVAACREAAALAEVEATP